MDRLRKRIAELEGDQPTRVAPATFITETMTSIPDALQPDFA
jgi:hypothetical protein